MNLSKEKPKNESFYGKRLNSGSDKASPDIFDDSRKQRKQESNQKGPTEKIPQGGDINASYIWQKN